MVSDDRLGDLRPMRKRLLQQLYRLLRLMSTVINVGNLGKKYTLHNQQWEVV